MYIIILSIQKWGENLQKNKIKLEVENKNEGRPII